MSKSIIRGVIEGHLKPPLRLKNDLFPLYTFFEFYNFSDTFSYHIYIFCIRVCYIN